MRGPVDKDQRIEKLCGLLREALSALEHLPGFLPHPVEIKIEKALEEEMARSKGSWLPASP